MRKVSQTRRKPAKPRAQKLKKKAGKRKPIMRHSREGRDSALSVDRMRGPAGGSDLRANATAYFVQFPHPGGEHDPPTDDMPWNTAAHRRKFLTAPGRYMGNDDKIRDAELVFWGEWEPPSRVERRWSVSGRLPRSLHRPYWVEPATNRFRQNTDPWVWGEHLIYSNCKQVTGSERRSTSMQRLTRGSVICFGSTISTEFCVDTVFVVASAKPWSPANVADLAVDDAFKVCTGGSLATTPTDADLQLMLYRGATVEDPVYGMFSFIPAERADVDDPRFSRPTIRIPEMINASSRQSARGSKRPLPIDNIRGAWEAVRGQVLAADLLLAVRLSTPDLKRSA